MSGSKFLGTRYEHLLITPGTETPKDTPEPVKAEAVYTGPENIRYQYRSEEVEAVQVLPENAEFLKRWCDAVVVEEIHPHDPSIRNIGVNVQGRAGKFRASEGDWVVRRSDNFFSKVAEGAFVQLGFAPVL